MSSVECRVDGDREKDEDKNHVSLLFALCSLRFALPAQAQQPAKVPRVGYLTGAKPYGHSARVEAFRQALRQLGYVEGKNILIEYRYAEGKLDRLPAFAAELVRLKVDVLVAGGPPSAGAAKTATSTIPIVMTQVGDPVGNGFVASLARPGGNITGLSDFAPEIGGKRLEIMKEIISRLSRVVVFGTRTSTQITQQSLREVELAARELKVQASIPRRTRWIPRDIETAFRAARKGRAEAVLMMVAPASMLIEYRLIDLAVKSRLPVI